MKNIRSTDSSRSFFCIWNRPALKKKELANLSPEEIVKKVIAMWTDGKPARRCAVNYEVADSGTPHLHMVLEDPAKTRFSAVCKLFPGIHCEATKGSKEDVEAYIYKTGKFAEKNHTIVVQPIFHGDIKGRGGMPVNPQRILQDIEDMINNGMTPEQIMELSIMYREKESLIRNTYFAKRFKETPPLRDITVKYHVGGSGSGKSYTFVQYVQEYGSDHVYLASDQSENGMFDKYNGEPYLFIDELRYMKYEILLQILQGYRSQMHARYANTYALWTQVDITSILPPEKLYEAIVPECRQADDGYAQLKRRINTIVYHYREENGIYRIFELPMSEYTDYPSLIEMVHGNKDKFVPVASLPEAVQQSLPFNTTGANQH